MHMDDQQYIKSIGASIVAQPVLVLGETPARWASLTRAIGLELGVDVSDTVVCEGVPSMSQLRGIVQRISLKPAYGSRSLTCFYHIDQWSAELMTVLLKTVEEPPSFAHLALFGSSMAEILATVRSRVVVVRLSALKSVVKYAYLAGSRSLADQFQTIAKGVEAEEGIDTMFEQWLTGVTDQGVARQLLELRTTIGATPINRRLALESGALLQRAGVTS